MKYKIYYLIDPRTNEIRYVGKTTKSLTYRLINGHMQDTSKTHKTNWIKSLKKEGLMPIIELVETCDNEEKCNYLEKYHIQLLGRADKGLGILVNSTDGGEGTTGRVLTKETKGKISKGNKGKRLGTKLPDITKNKIKESHSKFSKKKKKEISEKISKANIGKIVKESTKEKIRIANIGRIHSDESKVKISKNGIGYKHKNKSSKFIGVSYISTQNLYRTSITINKKSNILGHFKKEIDAAILYNQKAFEVYGNEAKLNKIKNWQMIDVSKKYSSNYVGVTYRAKKNKWESSVWHNNKHKYIGTFDTELLAAAAYNEYIIKHSLDKKLNII